MNASDVVQQVEFMRDRLAALQQQIGELPQNSEQARQLQQTFRDLHNGLIALETSTFLETKVNQHQQAQQAQMMHRVIQAIRNSLNLNTVFSTAVSEIGTLLKADLVCIMRYLPDSQLWVSLATYRCSLELPDITGVEILEAPNQLAHRLQQQDVLQLSADDRLAQAILEQVNQPTVPNLPEEWFILPLRVGASLWGSLNVARTCQFTSEQASTIELARAVADQLAIAIQQSELYAQVRRLNANLERKVKARTQQLQLANESEALLKRITDRVRDSLDEAQILQTAVQELAQGLGSSCCNAALFDLELGTSTICYEHTTTSYSSKGRVSRIQDFPELYDHLLQGRYFQFCSLLSHPFRERSAMLVCPILDDQGVLGDLWLINRSYHVFQEQDIRLVQQVANQCAIALRQSRLYQTAQAQVKELEKLNRLKDDFLSTISHELRSPMSSIKMAIQLLEMNLFKDVSEIQNAGSTKVAVVGAEAPSLTLHPASLQKAFRYFKILHDECQREINLINNLLDLSRLDIDTKPLSLATLQLQDWIPQIVEPFTNRMANRQQQLHLMLDANLPAFRTDLAHLERILTELLDNAHKYTPAGESITVSAQTVHREAIRVPYSGTLYPSHLQICVSNSGVEIPASEHDRIFDKFYRVPKPDPWQHGGTGLGLALVKKLTEHLGGSIEVKSAAGETSFIVQLPNCPRMP